jgi:hypothetical protein
MTMSDTMTRIQAGKLLNVSDTVIRRRLFDLESIHGLDGLVTSDDRLTALCLERIRDYRADKEGYRLKYQVDSGCVSDRNSLAPSEQETPMMPTYKLHGGFNAAKYRNENAIAQGDWEAMLESMEQQREIVQSGNSEFGKALEDIGDRLGVHALATVGSRAMSRVAEGVPLLQELLASSIQNQTQNNTSTESEKKKC